jgi:hypothetical protein
VVGSCGSCGTASLELALLRPADVVRLHELPSQVRGGGQKDTKHLQLRKGGWSFKGSRWGEQLSADRMRLHELPSQVGLLHQTRH